jgi:hypothetical protein
VPATLTNAGFTIVCGIFSLFTVSSKLASEETESLACRDDLKIEFPFGTRQQLSVTLASSSDRVCMLSEQREGMIVRCGAKFTQLDVFPGTFKSLVRTRSSVDTLLFSASVIEIVSIREEAIRTTFRSLLGLNLNSFNLAELLA